MRIVARLIGAYFFILLILGGDKIFGQIYPADGAVVPATRLPFTVDKVKNASSYLFHVEYSSEKAFGKNPVATVSSQTNTAILELPAFGERYSWRVEYFDEHSKKSAESPVYHFAAGRHDTNFRKYRLRVLQNRYPDTSLLFFADYANTLFNLSGKTIWRLPAEADSLGGWKKKDDIKYTRFNTITCISNGEGIEMDFSGNILWRSRVKIPEVNVANPYTLHHEFVKLGNGHYMGICSEYIDKKLPANYPLGPVGKRDEKARLEFGKLVEFDAAGNIVWEWKASEHFTDEELFSPYWADSALGPMMHLNAFYFDETEQTIYLGLRNFSQILKISYPRKTALAAYKGRQAEGSFSFYKQHTIEKDRDGNLCVFSNFSGGKGGLKLRGDDHMDSVARLIILKESKSQSPNYEVVWQFSCNIDTLASAASSRGGSFTPLPDGNYLVCMGHTPRVFIVSKQREILYNAIVEQWDEKSSKWMPANLYRASPLHMKDFDKLISLQN
jgi:hypothetical protein